MDVEQLMSDTKGFFQLILLSVGVMVVFTLIANLTSFGVSGPWAEVNALIAPLVVVICFTGMVAYVVTHR